MADTIEELKKKQAAIAAKIRRLEQREATKQKSAETNRLVLIGAMFSGRAKKNPEFNETMQKELERFLERDRERALFGFPPLPGSKSE